jgi:VWFA-related protein
MRILGAVLVGALCFGQSKPPIQPGQLAPTQPLPDDSARFVVPVNVVIAPTTVLDRSGNYVNGLTIDDFRLFDNGKPQRITADASQQPLTLVVAVQASSMLTDILPKIQRIGVMLDQLVVGDGGEAAVIAFDHRIRVIQDFTTDAGKVDAAMKKITPGSSTSAQIDAVTQSIRMLNHRPLDHRRVLLVIAEKRDHGSEGRLREALEAAQFANVAIYSIDISHTLAQLTGRADPPRPNPIPPEAMPVPAGAPQTPTQAAINQGFGNAVPMFVEIFKGVKSIFVDDTLDVFTKYTGGKEYSFVSQKALERSVIGLGEELHSQYLLSYVPNNQEEGGYHEIRVDVNRPHLEIRTRPGYWVASRF